MCNTCKELVANNFVSKLSCTHFTMQGDIFTASQDLLILSTCLAHWKRVQHRDCTDYTLKGMLLHRHGIHACHAHLTILYPNLPRLEVNCVRCIVCTYTPYTLHSWLHSCTLSVYTLTVQLQSLAAFLNSFNRQYVVKVIDMELCQQWTFASCSVDQHLSSQ